MLGNDLKGTQKELKKFSVRVIADARRNLKSKRKNTSGKLSESLSYEIITKDGKMTTQFIMAPYGDFVDKGVRGKDPSKIKGGFQKAPMSPFAFGSGSGKGSLRKALDKWIVRKGIAPRTGTGQFTSRESLKFAMSKSIYFQGISPSNFFTQALNKNLKKLPNELADGFKNDIGIVFTKEIKDPKK